MNSHTVPCVRCPPVDARGKVACVTGLKDGSSRGHDSGEGRTQLQEVGECAHQAP